MLVSLSAPKVYSMPLQLQWKADASQHLKGRQMSVSCPKCQSEVKPIESWTISPGYKVNEPPQPMWACLNPTCLHKWPKEATA
jgi:hypothetical protein